MKLLTIDGTGIVRRVYEASSEAESQEKAELALRHAHSSFQKILHAHSASHVLVAFDADDGSNWRHSLHPAYVRSPLPHFLAQQLPKFILHLQHLGLCVVQLPGAEVADILATVITRWLHDARGPVVIASNHRLLHALISPEVVVWDHFRQEQHDAAWVQQKYQLTPELLPQLLALVGDAGEGVPGVSRIGRKTAANLLNRYGNLDAVLAGAGILPDALGQRLRAERGALEISRQLMQMKSDLVLGVTWKMLAQPMHAVG